MQQETEWAQPIVVLSSGFHEDTILAGALASVRVGLDNGHRPEDVQALEAWLNGPFVKTVRRANLKAFNKVEIWAQEQSIRLQVVTMGKSVALALPPMKYSDFPKVISSLQVSGTDFYRRDDQALALKPLDVILEDTSFTWPISIQVLGELTTGKATAQAAHALWKWMEDSSAERVTRWADEESPTSLLLQEELVLPKELGSVFPIVDAGFTETEPGTLTAYCLDPWA